MENKIKVVLELALYTETLKDNKAFLRDECEGTDGEIYRNFCDYYDMPEWFNILLNDEEVPIVKLLGEIVDERK